jgi:hypothetical protein
LPLAAEAAHVAIDSSPFDAPSADAEALGRISGIQPTPASVEPVVLTPGSIEQQAMMLQRRCDQRSRWWAVHGDTPPANFNRLANQAGGIRDGGRPGAAPEQYSYGGPLVNRAAVSLPAVCGVWGGGGSASAVVDVCVATHMRGLVPHDRCAR